LRKIKKIHIYSIAIALISYYFLKENIRYTLLPHKIAIEYLYNIDFVFSQNVGYVQSDGVFAISGNCLGVNMFLSFFLILIFGFYEKFTFIKSKIVKFTSFYLFSLISALILTIVRIAASIPFCTSDSFVLIHNVISLSIYFLSAMVLYYTMERITK